MTTRIKHVVIGLSGIALLAGCSTPQKKDDAQALKVAPVQTVSHGAARAEAQYALGRYYRGQLRYNEAIAAFQEALKADPDHAEARNALGVLYAGQGRHDLAVAELERAAATAPQAAHIRNNLGYALLLQGQPGEAVAALEAAAALDPASERVKDNLRTARAQAARSLLADSTPAAAQAVPAPQPAPVAGPGPTPPANAAAPAAEVPSPMPAAAPVPGVPPASPPPSGRIEQAAANEYSLPAVKPAAVSEPESPATTPRPESGAAAGPLPRLEIANGNGVTGLARATARELQEDGYARPRLTNDQPYRLTATEIQYRPGFERQARELQARLRQDIPLAPSTRLRFDVQVRLALGKDVRSTGELLAAAPPPLRLAAGER